MKAVAVLGCEFELPTPNCTRYKLDMSLRQYYFEHMVGVNVQLKYVLVYVSILANCII